MQKIKTEQYQISIQTDDFDLGTQYQHIRDNAKGDGAIVTFTGIVRDFAPDLLNKSTLSNTKILSSEHIIKDESESADSKLKQANVTAIELEHYPGMTEKSLADISKKAHQRWQLSYVSIIHRVGLIPADQQIVFVGVSSRHRKSAFEAAEFLMDYLKNEVPLWKRECNGDNKTWVSAKESDSAALSRWENSD